MQKICKNIICNELMIYRTFTLYTTDVTRLLYQLQTRISPKMMLFCTILGENGGADDVIFSIIAGLPKVYPGFFVMSNGILHKYEE